VIGDTGSGKTTVARALAEKLGVPHIELDALFWRPGWQESEADEFRERVVAALGDEGWVVDGNYRTKLGSLVLGQADVIIWLDLPFRTTFPRSLRRTLRRLRTRESLWGTNVESWRAVFFSRESLLWWAVKSRVRKRRGRFADFDGDRLVRLRSQREVERLLREGV
jgi:adenylate kinase family enzyme